MEQVVHEVGHNAETFLVRSVVAKSRELSSLKTIQSTTLLRVEVRAVGIKPFDGLLRHFIPMHMVSQVIFAVGHEIGKDEGCGLFIVFSATHVNEEGW